MGAGLSSGSNGCCCCEHFANMSIFLLWAALLRPRFRFIWIAYLILVDQVFSVLVDRYQVSVQSGL